MRLILSRHGNTFNPGEPAVCVGAKNDLPLVEKGREQAKQLAEYLKQKNIIPAAIYCSPLQRTIEYADIVINILSKQSWTTHQTWARHASPLRSTIDQRLNELDYGDWTGLTSQEIIEQFAREEFENWEKNSRWPLTRNWGSSEKAVINDVQSLAKDLTQQYGPDDTVLVISSNGRLRYFLTLIPGEFERHVQAQTFKVGTGRICEMNYQDEQWTLAFWDVVP